MSSVQTSVGVASCVESSEMIRIADSRGYRDEGRIEGRAEMDSALILLRATRCTTRGHDASQDSYYTVLLDCMRREHSRE